jgi:hypothetical protein
MLKPITPQEIAKVVPDCVIRAVNQLLGENLSGNKVVLKQDDIIRRILCDNDTASMNEEDALKWSLNKDRRNIIFNRGWLDFESIYRDVGWKVVYDKPGYNESYAATFEFSRK